MVGLHVVLEEADEVLAFLGLGDGEVHVVAGDEGVGVGEPAVEGELVPDDVRVLEHGGVVEAGDLAGGAAEDSAEVRAFVVLL